MTPPIPGPFDAPPPLGVLLVQLRRARGWSQARLAEHLCGASGLTTVTRHEISRWERQERIPADFWLGWLARVLAAPPEQLMAAARRTLAERAPAGGADHGLGRASAHLVRLAHAWLADPTSPIADLANARLGAPTADAGGAELAALRRMDDVVGGLDLLPLVGERLAAAALPRSVPGRRRLFGLVAEFAQLAGWISADAGDAVTAVRAYQRALIAASAADDRPLAAHALGSASHLLAGQGHPREALLLARTAYAGGRREASARTRALLLHRIAFAAAACRQRREGGRALAAAERAADTAADRAACGGEPPWLYWLDDAELAAMTGRCKAALGRPLRAEPLLAAAVSRCAPPRCRALYGAWLAHTYLDLGEADQACRVAGVALLDAVRAGSARAVALVDGVNRRLARDRVAPAAARHASLVAAARPYLPAPAGTLPAAPTQPWTGAVGPAGGWGSAMRGSTG